MSEPALPTVRSLAAVAFESPRWKDWQEFGEETLAMEARLDAERACVSLRMDDREHRIEIREGDADRLVRMTFEVSDDPTLEAMFERVGQAGLSPGWCGDERARERGFWRMFRFADPAGFETEIAVGGFEVPGSFRPRKSGFLTGALGIGHVGLVVPDAAVMNRYVTDVLGFRVSDRKTSRDGGFDATFFHCNPRHHSVTTAGVPGRRGVHHLMVQVNTFDDVGETYNLAHARGEVLATLGRHTNDMMFSFYLRTPSNFGLEYGCDGRLVDDATWVVGSFDSSSIWGHKLVGERMQGAVQTLDDLTA